MNRYLVPANTKRAQLIMGILRPFPDLVIALSGTAITIATLIALDDVESWKMIVACLPMLIAVALVLPIPNYHNTLVGIQSIIKFFSERRNYIWKGWCLQNEFKDTK